MTESDSRSYVALAHYSIDLAAVLAHLHDNAAGGHCLFLGTTRNHADNRRVVTLFYEAYEEMAVREMRRLVEKACKEWPLKRCAVVHRLGEVPVGEASVAIGTSAAHRAEAFQACRYLIDALKREVPIWKREHFEDGESVWAAGSFPNRK